MNIKTRGEKYELTNGINRIVVDSYGAKVLAFYQNDENRLFYDSEDITYSGIPLCFPSFGPLYNSELRVDDKKYPIQLHGFLRSMLYSFVSKSENSLTFELKSNEETLSHYPFEFTFTVDFILLEDELEIKFHWHNQSKEKAPLSPGVHPYLKVYEKENIVLQTNALKYNLSEDFSKIEKLVDSNFLDTRTDGGFTIKGAPDLNLINHDLEKTKVSLGNNKSADIMYNKQDFNRLTVWRRYATDDYICIEPSNAHNKLNDSPYLVEADSVWESEVSIKFN